MRSLRAGFVFLWLSVPVTGLASELQEPPSLSALVESGALPRLGARLPRSPAIDSLEREWQAPGQYGGSLNLLMAKTRDLRQMVIYGYARLVGYTPEFELVPDLLERFDVEDGRIFTFHLRPGHRWSDGQPFTAEDFRYWWEDVANHDDLFPAGPPIDLIVEGEAPRFEIIDEKTVRYSWSRPNPTFLDSLANARPLYLYAPAHYLKDFHPRYTDAKALDEKVKAAKQRSWASLHNNLGNLYKNLNPSLPSLQPWVNTTAPPSERFVFKRNPYYHRVDGQGQQLPYIDEVILNLSGSSIIPAKTGAGESDLQARYLRFDNYTFLKEAESRQDFDVKLWRTARGSHYALYPNLNVADPVYRELFRDANFRRALSLAINRHEINQVIYFGLAAEGNNTVLPESPLYRPQYKETWATFDIDRANRLLDDIGLEQRNDDDWRVLADGRPLEIIVESAGESTEETDLLELVRDSWRQIGIKLLTKPSQREVFRNRVFAGETQMAIAFGMENALPNPDMSPVELAPAKQEYLQWPKWGQYVQTKGRAGEAPDMKIGKELMQLYEAWGQSSDRAARERIWHRMLEIHADQVLTIGIINDVPQPVVMNRRLRNLPENGIYNWHPGAFFGIYRLDCLWFDNSAIDQTAE